MFEQSILAEQFHLKGFCIARNLVSQKTIEKIKLDVESAALELPKYGLRQAQHHFSSIAQLTQNPEIIELAEQLCGPTVSLVRVIWFDKTADKNWLVSWHQDKTIAVSQRVEVDGWGPWSVKDGVVHVQPDLTILERMVTFRVHLDDSDGDNGCLKVIEKSHHCGLLTQTEIDDKVRLAQPFECVVKAGDAVLMKPHILHASAKAVNPDRRRVVHIEYCSAPLPSKLQWAP